MLLRRAYECEKGNVIEKLFSLRFYKMADGRQLYECSLGELKEVLKGLEMVKK